MDEEKDIAQVSLAAVESALAFANVINKRLAIVTSIALILVAVMFGSLMYFLTHFEVTGESVVVDSTDGVANYIGNDNNGEIINGAD